MACSLLEEAADRSTPADGAERSFGRGARPRPARPARRSNESEMTRYPDEKPVDHAPLTAEVGGNVRTQAGPGGDSVIVLKSGHRGREGRRARRRTTSCSPTIRKTRPASSMGWVVGERLQRRRRSRPPQRAGDGATPAPRRPRTAASTRARSPRLRRRRLSRSTSRRPTARAHPATRPARPSAG